MWGYWQQSGGSTATQANGSKNHLASGRGSIVVLANRRQMLTKKMWHADNVGMSDVQSVRFDSFLTPTSPFPETHPQT